jgi:hypothetical protein
VFHAWFFYCKGGVFTATSEIKSVILFQQSTQLQSHTVTWATDARPVIAEMLVWLIPGPSHGRYVEQLALGAFFLPVLQFPLSV